MLCIPVLALYFMTGYLYTSVLFCANTISVCKIFKSEAGYVDYPEHLIPLHIRIFYICPLQYGSSFWLVLVDFWPHGQGGGGAMCL